MANDKLLQAAKKNLDKLEDALGKKFDDELQSVDTAAVKKVSKKLKKIKSIFSTLTDTLQDITEEFYKGVEKAVGNKIFKSIFGTNSTDAETLQKIAKNIRTVLPIITAYQTAKVNTTLFIVSGVLSLLNDKKFSDTLTSYEDLSAAYKNLTTEIYSPSGNVDTIKTASKAFVSAEKNFQSSLKSLGVSIKLDDLPTPSINLTYNADKTAVTVASNYAGTLKSSAYKSSVKTIYAGGLAKAIEIQGNSKNNTITGGKGNDVLLGNGGNDILLGGKGNDSLSGGKGNDSLVGGKGNDILFGGKGNDTLTGGNGKDIFYYESGDGSDIITDYKAGDDKIKIDGGSIDKITVSGKNVTFKIGKGSVEIQNGKGKEITVVDANDVTKKYLNGKLCVTIPSDAVAYNGHSYKLFDTDSTWQEAETYCENRGGHLMTITDDGEQRVVEYLLTHDDLNHEGYYVGGVKDSDWKWIDGEDFSYTNFAEDEPNYSGNYLQVYVDGKWDDTTCDGSGESGIKNHGFICEWDSTRSKANNIDALINALPTANDAADFVNVNANDSSKLLSDVTFAATSTKR